MCAAQLRPQVQADAELWKPALANTVLYLVRCFAPAGTGWRTDGFCLQVLAPYDAEVSDILQRLKEEKLLVQLPSFEYAVLCCAVSACVLIACAGP